MRSFSPRVTRLRFGALVMVGSLMAAGGVIYATPQTAPAVQPVSSPGVPGVQKR
ncbi:hypothetical protein SAMN05444920_113140 [Nonomuraea solani]|uniref:Uncharacterized protein n=1 Tax=Nonomuraea solani TaxID=1144553 RepID=A0A1H6ES57_9ACTN|nr:hypothetical protein SAMN05444920_113140 [Nonomuraea solani]